MQRIGLNDPLDGKIGADVDAAILKDIFGADAISDVKEISSEETQQKDQESERQAIIDALKKSEGDTAQAAVGST